MPSFKVVDFIPGYARTSKHQELFSEMMDGLKDLEQNKSLMITMPDLKAGFSLMASARSYMKKQKIDEKYFVRMRKNAEDADGEVSVYFGKR